MKVSIITAVRNGARAIGATLDSVASQTYPDLEHVVIDGASTDGTPEIVRRMTGRLGTFVSERDAGLYDAFNKGLRHAKGDLIGFLGAGDRFVDEHAVTRLVEALRQSSASAVFADLAILDPETGKRERLYRSSSFAPERIGAGYMPAHPTLLLHRSVYERHGGYNAAYRVAGDFELIVRAFGLGRTPYTYVPKTLVLMEGGGVSNRGWRSKWIITKEMHRACREHGVRTSWLRLMSRLPAKYVAEVLDMKESGR